MQKRIAVMKEQVEHLENLKREYGNTLCINIGIYESLVLTTILYSSEACTTYQRHIKDLEHF